MRRRLFAAVLCAVLNVLYPWAGVGASGGGAVPGGPPPSTSVQNLTVSASSFAVGATSDYTVDFTTSPSGALSAGQGIVLTFSPEPTLSQATYAVSAGAAVAVSEATSAAGSSLQLTLTLGAAQSIAASTPVRVVLGNVVNPAVPGTAVLSVATAADALAASTSYPIDGGGAGSPPPGTSVQGLAILASTYAVGTTADYTLDFSVASALPAGGTIALMAPGTAFPGQATAYVLQDLTQAAGSGTPASPPTLGPSAVTFAVPNPIGAGDHLAVAIRGVVNPSVATPTETLAVATSADTAPAVSPPYALVAGPASRLAFAQQPGGGSAGAPWATQPVTVVEDAYGNVLTTAAEQISLGLGTAPVAARLTCAATTAAAVYGAVHWQGCSIDTPGTGYTLTADAGGLSPATSTPFNVTAGALPDLSVTSASGPGSASGGQTVTVSWTVYNGGSAAASGGWTDALYLSSTPAVAGATLLGTFSAGSPGGLAAGASYSQSQSVSIPASTAAGSHYLVVDANSGGSLVEADAADDTNNVRAWPLNVAPATALPDLAVTGASGPGSAGPGQAVTVSWTVYNGGSAAASGSWNDAVYLSSSSTLGAGAVALATFSESGHSGLAVGAAYTDREPVTVPAAATAGAQYLIFQADATGSLTEAGSGDHTFPLPITIGALAPVATHLALTATSPAVAGAPLQVTVTAEDQNGNTATGYAGRVHFGSSDGQAVLPPDYTFQSGDQGTHTFSGVVLKTAGSQSLTASDAATPSISGSTSVTVAAAAASRLAVQAFSTQQTAGSQFGLSVTAEDPYGNTATGYTGRVHFTTDDGTSPNGQAPVLPADYTFTTGTGADDGTHLFGNTLGTGVVLYRAGAATVTATDTATASITGTSAGITVNAGAGAALAFTTQPGGGAAGATWSTQPQVAVVDAGGNPVASFTASVTLAIGTNPSGGQLTCAANPVTAQGGVAAFSGCGIDRPGSGYTLAASSSTLATASSASFAITGGTSVQGVQVSVSPATAGATGATYDITFTPTTAVSAGQTVTVTAPAGTDFSGVAVASGGWGITTPNQPGAGTAFAQQVTLNTTSGSGAKNQAVITLPYSYQAGVELELEIVGVTNPPAGRPDETLTVATTADPAAATSAPYAIITLVIQTPSLPPGQVGTAYSAAITAGGGQAPYTFSLTAGALPGGLSLDQGRGTVSGTPSTAGTSTFTVQISDSSHPAQQTAATYVLGVSPSGVPACAPGMGSGGVYGAVTDAGTGTALGGARVEAYVDLSMPVAETTTSAGGCYALGPLSGYGSAMHVAATASGHAASDASETSGGWVQANLELTAQNGSCPASSGQTAYGLVSDALTGGGVSGATVSFGSGVSATTDAGGCYELNINSIYSPYGAVLQAAVTAPGYAAGTVWVPFAAPGAPTQLDVALVPGGANLLVAPPAPEVDAGSTLQLSATYSPGGGVPGQAVAASWESADTSVASVSATGLVSGVVGAGGRSTVVTANYQGISGHVTVSVVTPALTGITVSPATATLAVGQTQQLAATAQYANDTTGDITAQVGWSSSDTQVASVDGDGVVTALGPGTTTITASEGGIAGQAGVTVAVGPPAEATVVAGDNQATELGQPFPTQLAVRVLDGNANPVPAVSVTFTVPSAHATFGGSLGGTVSVPTGNDGVATAPPLRAGPTFGAFTVQVSVPGLANAPSFALTAATTVLQTGNCNEGGLDQAVARGGLVLLLCDNSFLVQQPIEIQGGQTVILDGTGAPPSYPVIELWSQSQFSGGDCGAAAVPNTIQGGLFHVCGGANLTIRGVTLSGGQQPTVDLRGPDGANGTPGTSGQSGADATQFGGNGLNGAAGGPGANGQAGATVQGGLLYVAANASVSIENSTLENVGIQGGMGGVGGAGGVGGSGGGGGDWCAYNYNPFYVIYCVYNGKAGGNGGAGAQSGGPGTGGAGGQAQGGAIYNAGQLTLTDDTFSGDSAAGGVGGAGGYGGYGGDGGSGGDGANAAVQTYPDGTCSGNGGQGGAPSTAGNGQTGGKGGSGGAAQGGAVYNASTGVLAITGGAFDQDRTTGGQSGPGGLGGQGAVGGYGGGGGGTNCGDGSGGNGDNGSNGGGGRSGGASNPGGNAQGGAIYSAGQMTVSGTVFGAAKGDAAEGGSGAVGGQGGSGGAGGQGGGGGWAPWPDGQVGLAGTPGCPGSGGSGGQGGDGGNGQGGAIYTAKTTTLNDVVFSSGLTDHNLVSGGLAGSGGQAGAGQGTTGGSCGSGGPGSVTAPTSPVVGSGPQQGADGTRGAASGADVFDGASTLAITTLTLPAAEVGVPYTATLDAMGGTQPYTWQPLPAAPLPSWAHLDEAAGTITGTPTAPGSFSFQVEVTDATTPQALSASAAETIPVVEPLTLTPAALAGATVGQPYRATLTAGGGTAPYAWTLTGLLPLGLSLASQGGSATITGTPLQAGPADFTVEVSDASNPQNVLAQAFVLIAAPAGIEVTGSSEAASAIPGGTATAGGTGSATPDTTATAQNGSGSVNVAYYSGDPGGTSTFAVQGTGYFDVNVSKDSTFTNVTITQCNLPSSSDGIWWDGPQGWVFASPQFASGGCAYLYLSGTSTPTVSQLVGSFFALGTPPAPAVTGLSPGSGPTSGWNVVTIRGSGFEHASAVQFGPTPVIGATVISDSEITATVPPGTGTVDVRVLTPWSESPAVPSDRYAYTLGGAVGSIAWGAPAYAVAPNGVLTVTGSVHAGDGQPVPSALVTLAATAGVLGASRATTDAQGSFAVTFQAPGIPGTVTLTASVGAEVSRTATITVGPAVITAPLPVAVSPAGASSPGASASSSVGSRGGPLATADGAFTMVVPAGAVPAGGTLWLGETVGTQPGGLPPLLPPLPARTTLASALFVLSGATLTGSPVATLRYQPAGLGSSAAPRLAVYCTTGSTWRALPTTLDPVAGTARAALPGAGTVAVLAVTGSYSDVPAGYWAAAALATLSAMGALQGYPDGTLRPDAPVTRAEFVKMLDVTVGAAPAARPVPALGFADVPVGAWYAGYLAAAVHAGMVTGVSPTRFSPEGKLTREQMAVLVFRALHLHAAGRLPFTDSAGIGAWAVPAVAATVAAGYLRGFPDGTFQPAGVTTRAQAAQVLARVLTALAPAGGG